MKVYVSRGSVAAGDDVDAPNARLLSVPDGTEPVDIIKNIVQSGYLPSIAGGHATWSVTSHILLAVVAQQWSEPRMFMARQDVLDYEQGTLRLYFNYHAQIDPETVFKVFWGFRLNAI